MAAPPITKKGNLGTGLWEEKAEHWDCGSGDFWMGALGLQPAKMPLNSSVPSWHDHAVVLISVVLCFWQGVQKAGGVQASGWWTKGKVGPELGNRRS